MNIGHLRSAIMTDSICRLFEFIGWDVKRKRQYEDEGSKIGTIIAELDQTYKNLSLEQVGEKASQYEIKQKEEEIIANDNI